MEFDNLLTLIKAMSDSELTELKYEEDGVKLRLSKKQESNQTIVSCGGGNPAVFGGNPAAFGGNPAAYDGNPGLASGAQTAGISVETGSALEAEKKAGSIVESPLVGIFYAAPAEDASPFVAVGDRVEKGQTLAIVEAMKLMNEIESDYSGTVAEIYVKNGDPVEYGQPLFRIAEA